MDEVIKAMNLCKSYRGVPAVQDLTLSVKRGTVFGLLGANGAGKTTGIECILGIRKPDGGKVSILGADPRAQRKRLFERIGVQFQEANYQREIRVNELCEETAALYRKPVDWDKLLDDFGIGEKKTEFVKDLSGGQRQRLFIVLALIPDPEVVILDELTTGLDVKARRTVWQLLKAMKESGLSILLTSHFMDEVEALCDEICILRDGRTVFTGTVEEAVLGSPFTRFEDAYLWYSGEEGNGDEGF